MTTTPRDEARPRMLVPERGLTNNRRNRRWLAMLKVCSTFVSSQEKAEQLAWELLKTYEETT